MVDIVKQLEARNIPIEGEHYVFLAQQCLGKGLVFDVGTHKGYSAYAMSLTAEEVWSFDINHDQLEIKSHNIEYLIQADFTENVALMQAELILIDVDPHAGAIEKYFLEQLRYREWKGIVLLDDTELNEPMQELWAWAGQTFKNTKRIIDAHYTGTGMIQIE
jgi:predicted O-methyltransferase YrrM